MSKYLFIETRDPFEFADVKQTWDLARELSKAGNDVSYFLAQNAVFAARKNADVPTLNDGGVKVLVDDVSLAERAIPTDSLKSGLAVSNVDELVDLTLEDGCKAIWT